VKKRRNHIKRQTIAIAKQKETQDPKFPDAKRQNYLKLNYLIYLFENEKR
jgi:hypothetical protein